MKAINFSRFIFVSFFLFNFVLSAGASVAPITVKGNKVLVDGKPVSLAGNSLFWSNSGWGGENFYSAEVVKYLKEEWGANVVRAAMGVEHDGGYLALPEENLARVEQVIQAAIEQNIYVIVDWHSHAAENYPEAAVEFFEKIAKKYGAHHNIIYEIYNEPLRVDWNTTIKPYAEAVVDAIRSVDLDNLIVVGTPKWSQLVDEAANNPIASNNIAYTLHFYAGTHGQGLRDKATYALEKGIALFVTEWGTVNADGDGEVDVSATMDWMSFLKSHQISHVNWAVNDKDEGASVFMPAAEQVNSINELELSQSGHLVKSIIKRWNTENFSEVIEK